MNLLLIGMNFILLSPFLAICSANFEELSNYYKYLTCYYNKYNKVEDVKSEDRHTFITGVVTQSMENK